MKNTKKIGDFGEELAVIYLKDKNYIILNTNYRNKGGEIDIIALDAFKTIVFIEVKSRRDFKSSPKEAVDYKKQIKITRAANLYLIENNYFDNSARFDVIEVLIPSYIGNKAKINHIENAFDEVLEV